MFRPGLYWRTLYHLQPIQITNRIQRRLFPARPDLRPAPPVRELKASPPNFISRAASIEAGDTFTFLNETRKLSLPADWDNNSLARLWRYNLHYFDGLQAASTTSKLKSRLIERWIADNPPGIGTGWEPYPCSLRIVNWIKWALSGPPFPPGARDSLAIQTRFLKDSLEYHILGNHLFANAKALIFAGSFFGGSEADEWRTFGNQILSEQIPEQFLEDGAHFELSTSYHILLTEDMLDLLALSRSFDLPADAHLTGAIASALSWLKGMVRPDGRIPLFNDSAYSMTVEPADLFSYAARLGYPLDDSNTHGLTDFQSSGYFRFDADSYCVIGDAGPAGPRYQLGHAHCDMLAFELICNGRPVIIDMGTSTYEAGPRRTMERSTASHNTVQIGGQEQSEIWGAFRVARRARIAERHLEEGAICATARWANGSKHRRHFRFHNDRVIIADSVCTSRPRERFATARFHFHPGITPEWHDECILAGPVLLCFRGARAVEIDTYQVATDFNRQQKAKVVRIEFDQSLESSIRIMQPAK